MKQKQTESKLKEITEKEFLKNCFESEEVYMKNIREEYANLQEIETIRSQAREYKELGYSVKYFLSDKGIISYVVSENKIGFRK
jgi:hypothetical protein